MTRKAGGAALLFLAGLLQGCSGEPEHPDTTIAAIAKSSLPAGESPGEDGKSRDATNGAHNIRVTLRMTPWECECRINGETAGFMPACAEKAYAEMHRLKTVREASPIHIDASPAVPYRHVVALLDQCVRIKIARSRAGKKMPFSDVAILIPSDRPFTVVQQVKLIRFQEPPEGELAMLTLPGSTTGEPGDEATKDAESVKITWDRAEEASSLWVGQRALDPDRLRAWMARVARSRVDAQTGLSKIPILIRCDRDASFGAVEQVLAICAEQGIRIREVRLAVADARR